MPATAVDHFQQDVARARAVVAHAGTLPDGPLPAASVRADLLRLGWMFAVGALDAYFCDAYTDVVAATIIAKSRHPATVLPDFFNEIRFPVRAILEPYDNNVNRRWRMAARQMMERETVPSLPAIQTLFNKFLRPGRRFFRDLLPGWIVHPAAHRLFGVSGVRFQGVGGALRQQALADAHSDLDARFRAIFQRRHDCIHNCDRPRVKPQPIVPVEVGRVIDDVEFLVTRCDEHLDAEFREFASGVAALELAEEPVQVDQLRGVAGLEPDPALAAVARAEVRVSPARLLPERVGDLQLDAVPGEADEHGVGRRLALHQPLDGLADVRRGRRPPL
ncbi:MAG: hypothetical protein ACRC33_29110, partial [Gemmataceae bacterium]